MYSIGSIHLGQKDLEGSTENGNGPKLLTWSCHIVERARFLIANELEQSLHYL